MIPVFQGAESPEHMETLVETHSEFFAADEAPHMAVSASMMGLQRRRVGASYVSRLLEQMPVILEGGVLHLSMDKQSLLNMQREYYALVESLPDLNYAVQFAHPSLEPDERILPKDERIIPFLFDTDDPKALSELLAEHGQVALTYKGDRRIPAIIRSATTGISLSVDLPDLDTASTVGCNAALIGSWVNPGKYGEIHIWDGTKFHRNDASRRDYVLERYLHVFERSNANMELVRKFDSRELQRVSAYSYMSWASSLGRKLSDTDESPATNNAVAEREDSAITVSEGEKSDRPVMPLPVFVNEYVDRVEYDIDGLPVTRSVPMMRTVSESVRVCDTCFLSATCPAFSKGASCQFNFPAEIRTDEQVRALLHAMLELQAGRVAFARFAEDVNGGMPDPQVGKEMDRLLKISDKLMKPTEKKGKLSFTVEAESSNDDDHQTMSAAGGVLSQIFGPRADRRQVEQQSDTDD